MIGPWKVPSLTQEEAAWSCHALLIGVDEVGRGPLAGPVVAAAVAFPSGVDPIPGVRDSKTLTPRQRADLEPRLRSLARVVGIAAASVREIDRFNIRRATGLAMRRALARAIGRSGLGHGAAPRPGVAYRILLDGQPMPECGFPHEALVDGDALCYSIAAAGIIAKQVRDRLMRRLALRYPRYGWESNAGYGTAQHCEAITLYGPTPHHRMSFTPVAQRQLGI